MVIRDAQETDLPAILVIHNEAVKQTTAIWDDAPVDLGNRQAWLEARRAANYPVLACDVDGSLAGYASFGDFRQWSGYRYTVEHSVYVGAEYRRRGIARLLLQSLIERAELLGKHAMIAGVEGANEASVALHSSHGFEVVGRLPQIGTKFGRWLDLLFMQRLMDQRPKPPH